MEVLRGDPADGGRKTARQFRRFVAKQQVCQTALPPTFVFQTLFLLILFPHLIIWIRIS